MPVRQIVTRSGKKFRGRFPSRKNATMVCWESLHERDAILLLEYSANVVSFEEQPSVETYYIGGTPHKYYPDIRARLSNDQVVDIEVKPKEKLLSPEAKEKYGRIAAMYKKAGRNFRILTELDYRAQPIQGNLKRLHRASKIIRKEADIVMLMMRLGTGHTWSLEKAGSLLGGIERTLALAAWRALCIDLRTPIGRETVVWIPGTLGGHHDPIQF